MDLLGHERYLAAVEADARLFAAAMAEGDPEVMVPSCPEWRLVNLCTHLGKVHRWVTQIVSTRAQERVDWSALPDAKAPADPAGLAEWLLRGALQVTAVLREAGPGVPVWGWAGEHSTGWWGRRMAQETLVHRIDAELAVGGTPGGIDAELAADNIDELLANAFAPASRAFPNRDRLRGEGEGDSLHVHCTDVPGEWLLRRTPEGFTYEHGHAKGDAVLRGPAAELMLLVNKRLPDGRNDVQVIGDDRVVGLWLDGLTLD
ncbi:maleylpyruvate isomerase family mycothiol-dependent enzyme [Streptacidiphilus carbonis]|uniref:maleylpyruvate isomerase family mycothiol-dependent enzyme n=1 Tax=Streptacidiphilus carbonis TaxID=105422 RepID=UPI0005A6F44C|nr:maleylpyruvate isomerase family mycothiol-dependent enzyme [Streptacidiphilus carbonis]